jgi:uncharacterized protein (DUF302 family)
VAAGGRKGLIGTVAIVSMRVRWEQADPRSASMRELPYGIAVMTDMSVADAEEKVRDALAAEGFGVLTEIDVAATLKVKLDLDRRPYKILGACNPVLAAKALETDEHVGLLLPCNVVVYETASGTAVEAMEPAIMAQMIEDEAIRPIAAEARERLTRALLAVEAA